MEKTTKNIQNPSKLPECFICKGTMYQHNKSTLPLLPKKYEEVLKDLNIPYRIVPVSENKERCEYWSNELYETKEVTLPSYTFTFNTFEYVGEHTGSIPTDETIEKAKELEKMLWKKIRQIDYKKKICYLQKALKKRPSKYVSVHDLNGEVEFTKDEVIQTDHQLFYIFIIRRIDGSKTGHIILFDKYKFKGQIVPLKVPKEYLKYIVGKEGCNCKKMAKAMGIGRVDVRS